MDGTILIADDDRTIRTVLSQAFTRAGCKVHATATLDTLMRWVEEGLGDLIVTDVMMPDGNGLDMIGRIAAARPGLPVIVISAQNTLTTAVRAEAARAADYLPKPFDLPDLLRRAGIALRSRPPQAAAAPPAPAETLPLVGSSPAMRAVFRQVARLLDADGPVLLCGETGTGKTTLAHAIHAHSTRRDLPLVNLDPDDLNVADRLADRLPAEDGGTVLVDGLADVTPDGQGRLVRAIDRAGRGTRFILTCRIDGNPFEGRNLRPDLISRIGDAIVTLPALRDRIEDIPVLCQHLADHHSGGSEAISHLTPEALAGLSLMSWPGNIWQLATTIRALATSPDVPDGVMSSPVRADQGSTNSQVMQGGHTPSILRDAAASHIERVFTHAFNAPPECGWHNHFLSDVEVPLLDAAMRFSGGNQIRAASLLGMNRNTLRKKLALHGIRVTRGRRVM